MEACAARDHAAIEVQLSAGADVNARAKRDAAEGGGETAVMVAAEKAHLWAVKRLLRRRPPNVRGAEEGVARTDQGGLQSRRVTGLAGENDRQR
jgi:hypothetical protein